MANVEKILHQPFDFFSPQVFSYTVQRICVCTKTCISPFCKSQLVCYGYGSIFIHAIREHIYSQRYKNFNDRAANKRLAQCVWLVDTRMHRGPKHVHCCSDILTRALCLLEGNSAQLSGETKGERMKEILSCPLVFVSLLSFALSQSLDAQWHSWKTLHSKVYSDSVEENTRRNVWLHNWARIEAHNRGNHSFSLALNHFADMVRTNKERILSCLFPYNVHSTIVSFASLP